MPDASRYVLLGRVPIDAFTVLAIPEGYPLQEADEALDAALAAEAVRQAFDATIAASPILSVEEATQS